MTNEKGSVLTSEGSRATVNRYGPIIWWASLGLIAVSVLLILRQLPVGPVVQTLEDWIGSLGVWGPLVFGLIYLVAVAALIPGSALTLAAGALFGLIGGTIMASLASTAGAALAFLIARYLARGRIAAKLQHYPKFDAIDTAIRESGWKIVALLRLSPAVPFNLQNYLYGLTGIRFWPCVLTSWLAMLPATFLYVYLGHLGREGLQAAAGGAERSRSPAEWAMPIVGLLATVAVTVYITRLARKALRQHTGIARGGEWRADSQVRQARPKGWPWGTLVTAALALTMAAVAGYTHFHPDLFQRLFAPLLDKANPRR
jgi:uncharacterized membrane protein YdjX (TVP38/TMEM64 family)